MVKNSDRFLSFFSSIRSEAWDVWTEKVCQREEVVAGWNPPICGQGLCSLPVESGKNCRPKKASSSGVSTSAPWLQKLRWLRDEEWIFTRIFSRYFKMFGTCWKHLALPSLASANKALHHTWSPADPWLVEKGPGSFRCSEWEKKENNGTSMCEQYKFARQSWIAKGTCYVFWLWESMMWILCVLDFSSHTHDRCTISLHFVGQLCPFFSCIPDGLMHFDAQHSHPVSHLHVTTGVDRSLFR